MRKRKCVVEQAPRLFVHEVSHRRFEVPINYRDRHQIERSMRTHHLPDPPPDCKDRPENETSDHRVFDAGKSQVGVIAQGKHHGSKQDDQCFRVGLFMHRKRLTMHCSNARSQASESEIGSHRILPRPSPFEQPAIPRWPRTFLAGLSVE